jgi:hypothetical protein
MRILTVALTLILTTATAALAADPTYPAHTLYPAVRADLIGRGWRPQPPPYPDATRCDDHPQFCKAWPEFVGCYVSLGNPCSFLWRGPAGVLAEVDTTMASPAPPQVPEPEFKDVRALEPIRESYLFHPREALPRFPLRAPYPEVRAGLIAQGYQPQPVDPGQDRGLACDTYHICGSYPEVMFCTGGLAFCRLIFRRASDGKFVLVVTHGHPPQQMSFSGIYPADDQALAQAFGPSKRPHPVPGDRQP